MIPPEDNNIGGPWDPVTFNYSDEVLAALSDENYEEVTLVASTQQGKSRIGLAWMAHTAVEDPSPMLIALPNLDDAQNFSRVRLAPMIRDMPEMRAKIHETRGRFNRGDDSVNVLLTKTFPRGYFKMVGTQSARGVRSNPCAKAWADEVDTYTLSAGKDGDVLRLIERRMDQFPIHTLFLTSTPTLKSSSRILKRYERSDKRIRMVPCPHCETYQCLEWDNLRWDKTPDGEHLPETAYFDCVQCHEKILPEHQFRMCQQGMWEKTAPEVKNRAGFRLWAAYNRDWRVIVQEWIEALAEGRAATIAFVNTVRAEGWEEPGDAPDWEIIKKRADPYESWTIPPEVYFLTVGVDVQRDRLEATILGWGLWEEIWVIAHDVLLGDSTVQPVWDELAELIHTPRVQEVTGNTLMIVSGAVDTGYAAAKDIAYLFSRNNPIVHAIKGSSVFTAPILSRPTDQDINHNGRTEKNGLKLWTIGVSQIKAMVYSRLRKMERGPKHVHFPMDLPQDYYQKLTSEKFIEGDKKTYWEQHGPNEPFDTFVYNVAAAWIGQVYKIPWALLAQQDPRPNQAPAQAEGPEIIRLTPDRPAVPVTPSIGAQPPEPIRSQGLGSMKTLLRGE